MFNLFPTGLEYIVGNFFTIFLSEVGSHRQKESNVGLDFIDFLPYFQIFSSLFFHLVKSCNLCHRFCSLFLYLLETLLKEIGPDIGLNLRTFLAEDLCPDFSHHQTKMCLQDGNPL